MNLCPCPVRCPAVARAQTGRPALTGTGQPGNRLPVEMRGEQ